MSFIIGLVSQKGGVGKSSLARLVAREAADGGLTVKIADLDTQQQTCTRWAARRIAQGITPEIEVQPVGDVRRKAREEAPRYDLYIFDGAPQASRQTAEVAQVCDLEPGAGVPRVGVVKSGEEHEVLKEISDPFLGYIIMASDGEEIHVWPMECEVIIE